MNILFVTAEVAPYSKTGGLGDVTAALPKALRSLGHGVSVLSPLYPKAAARAGPMAKPLSPLRFRLGKQWWTGDLLNTVDHEGVRRFFLDVPDLYGRNGVYGENGGDYPDNGLRFAVLSKAAVVMNLQYQHGFEVLHCHDWQAALVPLFRQTTTDKDGTLGRLATVLTIHNLAYQGLSPLEEASKLGIPKSWLTPKGVEFHGKINPMKAGILNAHMLTTVSPTYAEEIRTPEHGAGLDAELRARKDDLRGILNGVDYSVWSPELDGLIPARFDADHPNGKRRCKAFLQAEVGLNLRPRLPLLGVVSRLVEHKGIDLILEAVPRFLDAQQAQLAVVGDGNTGFPEALAALKAKYPKQVSVHIGYQEELAHLIFAASDIFLMPSRFEPCGLSQLYAMRYGSIPVVRATGGLADTVQPYDPDESTGTGFVFQDPTADALGEAISNAIDLYHQARRWRRLMCAAMETDFSWKRAANEYVEVYETAREKVRDRQPEAAG